jgi:hypothetical protein
MINPIEFPFLISAVSFLVLWTSSRAGCRYQKSIAGFREDFGIVLTATLTLLGLIVGFTFSMAVSRYDQRKLYEEQEANAIGTEYLRTELLSPSDSERLRRLLREYLDQRILFYQTRNKERLRQIDAATAQLQTRLWASLNKPSRAEPTPMTALVASGMNDVLNSQGYTQAAWKNRIPFEAWVLMGVIAICGNFMVGVYLRSVRASAVLLMVLPAIVSLSFLLIADIDSPRGGLIHIKPQNLISVAQSMRS